MATESPTPKVYLVGGGARSGKSRFALELARRLGPRRVFVATAEARDDEMRVRIRAHRTERGDDFRTIEEPWALCELLAGQDADVVLVDCLTLWLTNVLLDPDRDVMGEIDALAALVAARRIPSLVLVTSEVGLGLVPETPLGRRFRDLAGLLHQSLAARSDRVYLAALGTILRLRPGPVEAASPAREA